MNYPLISEYVQSVKLAEDNFDKLQHLRPVLDGDGNPVMSSGNFAVVFKMQDTRSGKFHAVKCFLRDQPGRDESYRLISSELEYVSSSFLTPVKYMDKELFVDTTQGGETEFPILLMDWVEGMTLDRYIRSNIHDTYKLSLAAYQFCRMGAWLLAQEFAHGDLKPDNIIMVGEGGQPVLIDYDGMFVPAMRGRKAREIGSTDYRHPLRTEDVFDAGIDDFSIASIALSLKAISLKPELLGEFGADDRLLFSAADYRRIGESECLKAVVALADDRELSQLLGLFLVACARNGLGHVSFKLLNIGKPEPTVLSTKVTDEDLADAIEDEQGAKYSRDGLRLLRAPDDIERYEIREGVRIICDSAFCDFNSYLLCEVIIPNSVTSIGNWAFSGCWFLREVVIPNSVTSIGNGAFYSCRSLCEVVIPNSVTSIEKDTFHGCRSLREVVIPNSVTSIGNGAFYSCRSLCEVVIPDSVTSIGDSAFSECSSLREVVIPDSVTSIGDSAFSECSSLREVVIPASVTSIRNYAFSKCFSLWEVAIPASVTSIGDRAFFECSLRKVAIPASVTSIGDSAFSECSLRKVVIPASVTSIRDYAFSKCSSLCEVVIPASVTSIRDYAFSKCSSLREVVIPASVTSIGDGAFSECSLLREVVIPDSVTSIGNGAFRGCSSLREVVIPNSVTSIGGSAFWGCSSLREVVIPNFVTSIGDSAFSECSSLREVAIPDSVTSIGRLAFRLCKSLCEVVIPASVTSIGYGAFYGCGVLHVISHNSMFGVVDDCMLIDNVNHRLISSYNCKEYIAIPDFVTSIGDWAFNWCESLREVVIPASVTSIGKSAFSECSSLREVVIPSSVTSIGDWAFSECSSLREVVIPSSVTSIGYWAFYRCESLVSIIVPKGQIQRFKELLKYAKCDLSIIKER